MTELTFAKSFLAAVESRPVKLRPDHVFDPRSFQMRQPFVLPKLNENTHPRLPKRIKSTSAPGAAKAITLTLKSTRNPALEVTLDKAPLSTTSVQDLKEAVQARTKPANGEGKVPLEKIKILWKRKPVQGRTVEEALTGETALLGGGGRAEFGVMILGGAVALEEGEMREGSQEEEKDVPTRSAEGQEDVEMKDATTMQGAEKETTTGGVLDRAEFWDELQGFLRAKVGDEQEAARLKGLFKGAWESSK